MNTGFSPEEVFPPVLQFSLQSLASSYTPFLKNKSGLLLLQTLLYCLIAEPWTQRHHCAHIAPLFLNTLAHALDQQSLWNLT